MATCPQVNCSSLWGSPPQLQPNPDISGIGVLVGFMASAFITWILLVFHYVVVYDPEKASLTHEKNEHPNPVDLKILKWASVIVNRPSKTWEAAVEKLVLMLSDQQMITGIALLVSGVSQLRCSISAFHWQIVVYLVWYSSFTHLATLTVLRRYLRDNKPMRWWRLSLMSVLIVGLCAALVPTGNGLWLPDPQENVYVNGTSGVPFSYIGMPAVCFYRIVLANDRQLSSMIVSIIVLVSSYTFRAIKLFQWSSTKARELFRTIPGSKVKRFLDKLYLGLQEEPKNKWIISVPYWLVLDIYLIARACFDLAESMMWEITWLLISLLWGTLRLFSTRNLTFLQDWPDAPEVDIFEENAWGFAQCLSTTMLLLILFTVVEVSYETIRKTKEEESNKDNTSDDEDPTSARVSLNAASSPTPGNSNDQTDPLGSPAGEAVEYDMSIRPQRRADASIPLQPLLRSATVLSLEERTIDRSEVPIIPEQSSHSGSRASSQDAASPPSVVQATAPHHENFYQYTWFWTLVLLIFVQALFLSLFVLLGAYGAYNSFAGFFQVLDPAQFFLFIWNWITLYAPGTTMIYAAFYLFPRASAHWKWRQRFTHWYEAKYPRPHTRQHKNIIWRCRLTLITAFLSCSFYLLLKFPVPPFWENYIPYSTYIMPFLVATAIFLIAFPWGIVLVKKLRRHVLSSS